MMKLQAPVYGYKIFNPDWTCRNKQYTCPGEFKEDVKQMLCDAGMHFCPDLKDCFEYYPSDPNYHCAEVVALDEIVQDGDECATNHLQIIREIPWDEVLKRINQGKGCTGIYNTGNYNTGDSNVGNYNTGNRNTGNFNIGDWNTGICNAGDFNTGNRNTGDFNTGDFNTGDWNTGDWNIASFSSGVFCTEEPEALIFNKPSGMTLRQWHDSKACHLLNQILFTPNAWIWDDEMTDEEKEAHPEYKIAGGFLKVLDTSDCCARWWESLDESDRDIIRSIPNFDAAIFKQITGIDATKK